MNAPKACTFLRGGGEGSPFPRRRIRFPPRRSPFMELPGRTARFASQGRPLRAFLTIHRMVKIAFGNRPATPFGVRSSLLNYTKGKDGLCPSFPLVEARGVSSRCGSVRARENSPPDCFLTRARFFSPRFFYDTKKHRQRLYFFAWWRRGESPRRRLR